jgi:ribonuclease M5
MIKVSEVIIVEGRYDKNTLSQVIDGTILETRGFGIFSDRERLTLFRRLAEERGLVVMTDSDGAGFVIRNFLKGAIDPSRVKHAYIPDVAGKERRKSAPSRTGRLGVEGMAPAVLLTALKNAGVACAEPADSAAMEPITKADLYMLGLSGGRDSREKRLKLLKRLELPAALSPNAMLELLNLLMSRDAFYRMAAGGLAEEAP